MVRLIGEKSGIEDTLVNVYVISQLLFRSPFCAVLNHAFRHGSETKGMGGYVAAMDGGVLLIQFLDKCLRVGDTVSGSKSLRPSTN